MLFINIIINEVHVQLSSLRRHDEDKRLTMIVEASEQCSY